VNLTVEVLNPTVKPSNATAELLIAPAELLNPTVEPDVLAACPAVPPLEPVNLTVELSKPPV